jgi:hypothetical protein
MHADPGDGVAERVHLAGVDPGPELDTERGRLAGDGGRWEEIWQQPPSRSGAA